MKKLLTLMLVGLVLINSTFVSVVYANDTEEPKIIWNTWKAEPGDIISINGADLADGFTGLRLQVLSEENDKVDFNKAEYDLEITNLADDIIQALLPEDLPDGMYCMWVTKGDVKSEVMYVNKAFLVYSPWIYGYESQEIRVSGRNLLNPATGEPTNIKAYLTDEETGERIDCKVTFVTDWYIKYKVPQDAIAGHKYYIHYQNGLGGDLGFSTAERYVPITIVELNENVEYLEGLTGTQYYIFSNIPTKNYYNVTEYGVVGDGETDNTDAILALTNKLRELGGGVLYFPKGEYLYRNFQIPANTFIYGEDRDETLLTVHESVTPCPFDPTVEKNGRSAALWGMTACATWTNEANVGLYNLTLNQPNSRPAYPEDWRYRMSGWCRALILGTVARNVDVVNISNQSQDAGGYMVKSVNVRNIDGAGIYDNSTDGALIEDCSIKVTHTALEKYGNPSNIWNQYGSKLIDSYLFNTQRPTYNSYTGSAWIENTTFDGQSAGENREANFYDLKTFTGEYPLKRNVTVGSEFRTLDIASAYSFIYGCTIAGEQGVRRTTNNDGEGICNQGAESKIYHVVSATENTITHGNVATRTGTIYGGTNAINKEHVLVYITSGKGRGQVRWSAGYDEETQTLTVDRPWDVIPDDSCILATSTTIPYMQIIANNKFISEQKKGCIMPYTEHIECVQVNNESYNSAGILFTPNPINGSLYTYTANNYLYKDLADWWRVLLQYKDGATFLDSLGYPSALTLGALEDSGLKTASGEKIQESTDKYINSDGCGSFFDTYKNNAVVLEDTSGEVRKYLPGEYNAMFSDYSGIILFGNSAAGKIRCIGTAVNNNYVSGTKFGVYVGNSTRGVTILNNKFENISYEEIGENSNNLITILENEEVITDTPRGAIRTEFILED